MLNRLKPAALVSVALLLAGGSVFAGTSHSNSSGNAAGMSSSSSSGNASGTASMDQSSSQKKSSSGSASIQNITQSPSKYVGKQVSLSGKVERVLGPDSFVMSSPDDSTQRLLVVAAQSTQQKKSQAGQEQAGTQANPLVKDDQKVQVTGKVAQLALKTESVAMFPKKNQEVIRESLAALPVLIVPSNQIKQQG